MAGSVADVSIGVVETVAAGVSVGIAGMTDGDPAGVAGSFNILGIDDIHNSLTRGQRRELDSVIGAVVRDFHVYPPRLGEVRERLTDTGITNMMILARLELHWNTDEQRIGYVSTQTRIVDRANV